MYVKIIKRGIDFFLSFLGLILLSWLFVIIALIVVIDDPGNPFFAQKRIGEGKKLFCLYNVSGAARYGFSRLQSAA